MKELLVIVPSRGRPESVEELSEAFFHHSDGLADLLFATDDDQEHYPFVKGVMYERGPRLRLNGTLNRVANKYADIYDYIGFMGDDHRPRTHGWDTKVIWALRHNAVVYGNDLIWGAGLPTAVFLQAEVIRKLGYMAPPELVHMYLDNFWLEFGKRTSIKYLDDVVIEHMHPSVGKGEWTPEYLETNSQEMYDRDRLAFSSYLENRLEEDLKRFNG